MQNPIYSPADEQKLMAALWDPRIADDPEAFVRFVFPWGKPNTPLANFKGPRKWQCEVLRTITDHIKRNKTTHEETLREAVSSGRGIGKSALVSWLTLWMLTTRIGATVVVSANSESQLRSVTWGELAKWTAMLINSHWWEISATKLTPAIWLSTLVERDLKKGTRYWAAEGKLWSEENPDAYAGVHNHDGMMLIFDEGSGIPPRIWDVGAGFFTEPILDRYWFAFSNPRRNDGAFFECFNAKRDFWNSRKVDARFVEDTDPSVYESIIAEHGADSYQARVEVYGEFPLSGEDQFISPLMVDEAIERKRYEDDLAPIVIGVDVARYGADKTVIAVRQGRDLVHAHKYSGLSTMQVVGKVIEAIITYDPVLTVIDEGGLGAGVLDRLLEQRYKVRGVNFGSRADDMAWADKRSEMWGALRDWMKTASIGTGDKQKDREMRTDFTGPSYKLTSTGATKLEAKEAMKKRGVSSPDVADAVALTLAFPVAYKRAQAPRHITQRAPSRGARESTGWLA